MRVGQDSSSSTPRANRRFDKESVGRGGRVAQTGVELGYAFIADLRVAVAGEHLGDQVTAFTAKTAAKILVHFVEITLYVFVGNLCFHPACGRTRINALRSSLGVGCGIVD